MVKVVVIAGTHSGVGKTSLSVGLMLALRQRGLVVQPFKVGPDFLDPQHHVAACGRASINLDGWMLNRQQVLDTFHRHTADADIAVVEGVMGLYDSRDGASDDGSTAQVAKWLGAPVVLVMDCWAMARSAAALAKGYAEFDPDLHLQGVIFNKVGSVGHGVWLTEALKAAWQQGRLKQQVHVLGCVPQNKAVTVPERYLGLAMPHEQDDDQQQQQQQAGDALCASHTVQQAAEGQACCMKVPSSSQAVPPYLQRLYGHVSQHVDLDLLLQLCKGPLANHLLAHNNHMGDTQQHKRQHQQQQQHEQQSEQQQRPASGALEPHSSLLLVEPRQPPRCRIAVARDEAFCFYYEDNLALLRAAGAEVVFFSPLHSPHLPPHIHGVYLGGGYPERHVIQLSRNNSMLQDIRQWSSQGGVVYAECGGLMYLCKGLVQGEEPQAGAAPTDPAPSDSKKSSSTAAASDRGGKTSCSVTSSSDVDDEGSDHFCQADGGRSTGGGQSGVCCSSGMVQLVGVLPLVAHMGGMKMGYVEVEVLSGNPLFPVGATARGQLYHFSEVVAAATDGPYPTSASSSSQQPIKSSRSCADAVLVGNGGVKSDVGDGGVKSDVSDVMQLTYRLQQVLPGAGPVLEGYSVGQVLASYVHLHWGGCPSLAAALVDKCCGDISSVPEGCSLGSADSGMSHDSCAVGPESGVMLQGDDCHLHAATAAQEQAEVETNTATQQQRGGVTVLQADCGRQALAQSGAHLAYASSSTTSSSSRAGGDNNVDVSGGGSSCLCGVAASSSQICLQHDNLGTAPVSSSSSTRSSSIVSLVPSATEILYTLGLQDRLVGVSGFCDWPPEARAKPQVVRSLVDTDSMSSDQVEAAMQSFKAAGESPFEVNTSLLAQQAPGLVLTQDACQTCDADCSLVCRGLQQAGLTPTTTQVMVLHPTTLLEVFHSILAVGAATGSLGPAQRLVDQLEGRLGAVATAVHACCPSATAVTTAKCTVRGKTAAAPHSGKHDDTTPEEENDALSQPHPCSMMHCDGTDRTSCAHVQWQQAPRVLSLEGLNPLVLGGQWLPDVKLAAGGVDASGQAPGDPPRRITWEQVLSYQPDVLLLTPCGRSPATAMPDVMRLAQLPGFMELPAVRSNRVYVVDHGFFSRPGPRLVDGVELLQHLLWCQSCDASSQHQKKLGTSTGSSSSSGSSGNSSSKATMQCAGGNSSSDSISISDACEVCVLQLFKCPSVGLTWSPVNTPWQQCCQHRSDTPKCL